MPLLYIRVYVDTYIKTRIYVHMNIFFIEYVLIRRSATGLIPWLIFALIRRPSDPGSLFFVSVRVNSAVVFVILCFLLFLFFFLCFFLFVRSRGDVDDRGLPCRDSKLHRVMIMNELVRAEKVADRARDTDRLDELVAISRRDCGEVRRDPGV